MGRKRGAGFLAGLETGRDIITMSHLNEARTNLIGAFDRVKEAHENKNLPYSHPDEYYDLTLGDTSLNLIRRATILLEQEKIRLFKWKRGESQQCPSAELLQAKYADMVSAHLAIDIDSLDVQQKIRRLYRMVHTLRDKVESQERELKRLREYEQTGPRKRSKRLK